MTKVVRLYKTMNDAEMLYRQAGKIDEHKKHLNTARSLYEEALRIRPNYVMAMVNLGNVFFKQGNRSVAEKWWKKALSLEPDSKEALYNMGFLYQAKGDLPKAEFYYMRTIEADPDFPDAHFNLGMVYETWTNRKGAIEHFQKYTELEKEGEFVDNANRAISRLKGEDL